MTFDPSAIARTSLRGITPYQAGEPLESISRHHGIDQELLIKLNANENPHGPSPKAIKAIQGILKNTHRYPDTYDLSEAIVRYHGVAADQVVLGTGSTEVIDLIARTFLGPETEAVSSQYGFSMFAIMSALAGAQNIIVPAKDYAHNLPAMAKAVTAETRVVWIANPNNPTGTFAPYHELETLLETVPATTMVAIDEAYYDYLEPSEQADIIRWLPEHPNLIILRTFSKIYGLAGLRIGYGIMNSAVASLLNRVRQPLNITAPAAAGAAAALQDRAFTQACADKNRAGREQLESGLRALGINTLPAKGNFVTAQFHDASHVCGTLLDKGIILRPLTPYALPDHVRITIGTSEENSRLLASIDKILR